MDHLEIWKHLTNVQAVNIGLSLGLFVAIVLHWNDYRNRNKKVIK